MDSALAQQISQWRAERDYQKIVDAIEAIDGYRVEPELEIERARAYMAMALRVDDPFQKDYLLRLAIDGLLACYYHLPQPAEKRPTLGVDPWREWHYQLGSAYQMFDFPHRAAQQFAALVRIDPDYRGDSQERLKQNFDRAPLVLRHRSFDARVQEFWNTMGDLANAPDEVKDLSCFENPDALQKAFTFFDRYIRLVIPNMDNVALGPKNGRITVFLPVGGSGSLLLRYVQLLSQKPENCAYDFEIGFPAERELPDEALHLRMVCRLAQQNPAVFVVGFAEDDLRSHPEEERRQVALRYLYDMLGEVAALRYVGDVALLSELPADEPVYHLPDLKRLITEQGLPLTITAEEVLKTVYTFEEEPVDEDFLRSDIYRYSTTLLDVVSDWKRLESTTLDLMWDSGAFAGMFLLPPADTYEEARKLAETFQKTLMEDLGEKTWRVVRFVGVAYGKKHTYVDFIAWRLRPLVRAAERARNQLKLEVSYQPFDFRYPVQDLGIRLEKNEEEDFN